MMAISSITGGASANSKWGMWRSPLTWLAAVQLIAAYEWLVSGLNKIVAGNFPTVLHGVLAGAIHGNPNGWAVGLLKSIALPCCTQLGSMVECGEVLVGVALVGATALWLLGDRLPMLARRLGAWTATVACLSAAAMNFTFYVAMGGTIPTVTAANATNEGVSIDVVLMLVMLALAAANLALAPRRVAAPAAPERAVAYTR